MFWVSAGQRQRVRAEIGLALAIADHQRRAEPRADQHVGHARGTRSPARMRRAARGSTALTASSGDVPASTCSLTRCATTSVSVSLSNTRPRAWQRLAQRLEILDDAVVDQRDFLRRVRMRVDVVGAPCVAQRVWAMPVVPGAGSAASTATRLASFPPRGGGSAGRPGRCRPRPNHSRDIPSAAAPRRAGPRPGLCRQFR